MNFRVIIFVVFICLSINLASQMLPHPLKTEGFPVEMYPEEYEPVSLHRNRSLTNNILVIRVDFPDRPFLDHERFPAYHPHNEEYFRNYMEHLKNFYLDASGGNYELNYYIAPQVYTMSENLGWYGDDEYESRRRVELIGELVAMIGDGLPFKDYEGLIVFHSGAGQESDIYNNQRHTMSSTYMSQASFRNVFDPTNEDYEGIPTADGSFITRAALIASEEYHPGFEEIYDRHYEILGVLTFYMGRMMGLPTLFGNVSAYGQHAGTGNFCIMGTGMWNNNGKTPPLPSAWVRIFAGWEEPIIINQNVERVEIGYHLANDLSLAHGVKSQIPPPTPPINVGGVPPHIYGNENSPHIYGGGRGGEKIYRVNISEKEYFLIENRQHNHIKDFYELVDRPGEYVELAGHSFQLLPPGVQEYQIMPTRYGDAYIPIVDLMKNNLRGSEWDYFMPYIDISVPGGRYQDPSGLFIWHIDENVIDANLSTNTINANPNRRGVALKEADGVQHLASTTPHQYMRGGPFKSYREDNNDYLGYQTNPFTGHYSTPTSESYYSGISFEIFRVSPSDDIMTFSVRFEPFSEAEFLYQNFLEPFVFDFNNNGINEVHFFHSDGFMTVFENNQKINTYWLEADTLSFNYVFDGKKIYIPAQDIYENTRAKLIKWDGQRFEEVWGRDNWTWASSPVYIDNNSAVKWVFSLHQIEPYFERNTYRVTTLDENLRELDFHFLFGNISNLIYDDLAIYLLNHDIDSTSALDDINLTVVYNQHSVTYGLNVNDIDINGKWTIYKGDFLGKQQKDPRQFFFHYQYQNINRYFLWGEYADDNTRLLSKEFQGSNLAMTVGATHDSHLTTHNSQLTTQNSQLTELHLNMPYQLTGQPVFKDINKNGVPEIILSHTNGFSVYTMTGNLVRHVMIDNPDPLNQGGSGVIAWNWANDDNVYYLGGFSRNRLMFFDSNMNVMQQLTRTLAHPFQTYPYITMQGSDVILHQATDMGRVYDIKLTQAQDTSNLRWNLSYGNYFRNGIWDDILVNSFENERGIFVRGENYAFPSPFINSYHDNIRFQVMTTISTPVEISIYTIAGQLVARQTDYFHAFEANRNNFVFYPERWSSGVYFAVLKAQNNTMNVRFAIER